jgi:hypothetical protein
MLEKGTFCCGIEAGAACCANNEGVWIANGTTTNVNPLSTTNSGVTTTKSIIVTPTASTSQISSKATGSGTSKTTGSLVGGVVVGIVSLAFIAAMAWFLWRRRSRRRALWAGPNTEMAIAEQEILVKGESSTVSVVEAPKDTQLHEMDMASKLRAAELP